MEHDVLEYKGYTKKVKVDLRKGRIYGKVLGVVDAVNDECTSASEVEDAFHDAVDKYLAFCENVGRRPAKSYKGIFNVRLEPVQHRGMAMWAMHNGVLLNDAMKAAVQDFLDENA